MLHKLLFIDWDSTEYHSDFNRAMFNALGLKNGNFIVFSKKLVLKEQNSTYVSCSNNRLKRALKVMKICWQNRKHPIFLLTYDPVLIIFIQLFAKFIYTYEHNTTPERNKANKHALFQKTFYWRITRFTQYPSQLRMLQSLKQRCFYAGSPLEISTKAIEKENPTLFLTPSDRREEKEILKLESVANGSKIVLRKSGLTTEILARLKERMDIVPVDWIDLDECLKSTKCIAIATTSAIRGTGWFNESIKHGIPILITNRAVQTLFEETFPEYPYLRIQSKPDESEFENHNLKISFELRNEYIKRNNEAIKNRIIAGIR